MERPDDYKRYMAIVYYTAETGGKNYFMRPPMERVKELLSLENEADALAKGRVFAKAHPTTQKICVIISFYTKKDDYNYRTDRRWYRWNKNTLSFDKDEWYSDTHW